MCLARWCPCQGLAACIIAMTWSPECRRASGFRCVVDDSYMTPIIEFCPCHAWPLGLASKDENRSTEIRVIEGRRFAAHQRGGTMDSLSIRYPRQDGFSSRRLRRGLRLRNGAAWLPSAAHCLTRMAYRVPRQKVRQSAVCLAWLGCTSTLRSISRDFRSKKYT
jgi:hypothetical protein